jgi:hypothetical protein
MRLRKAKPADYEPAILAVALLAAGKRIAELGDDLAKLQTQSYQPKIDPATPSGQQPIYRLRKRDDFTPKHDSGRIGKIDQRLCALAAAAYADASRLAKRLSRTRDHLWTFLHEVNVRFENNFAERQIRPALILRKNSQSNRSEQGAATQGVLMSIHRTLRLRGHNPAKAITDALKSYLINGKPPPLPAPAPANG